MKINLKTISSFLIKVTLSLLAIFILGWFGFWYLRPTNGAGPISKARLCRDLGHELKTDPLCDEETTYSELLAAPFTVGITTREEIRKVLGPYFKESHPLYDNDDISVMDIYVIKRELWVSKIAVFYFGDDGILLKIKYFS